MKLEYNYEMKADTMKEKLGFIFIGSFVISLLISWLPLIMWTVGSSLFPNPIDISWSEMTASIWIVSMVAMTFNWKNL